MVEKMNLKLFFDYCRHPLQTLWCMLASFFVILAVRIAYDIDKKYD